MHKENRKRHHLLCGMIALTASMTLSPCLAESSKTPKPNVVLFIADDVSVDDFGCYGHLSIRTPNIDQLAGEGMRFNNAYLVTSQCSPSRCSILTGRYPHNHGAPELHQPLPADQPMFSAELKNAGYYCVQAGKWHMGEAAKAAFDEVYERESAGHGGERRWVQSLAERPKDRPFFAWFAASDAHRSWQKDQDGTPHTREDVVIPPYLVDNEATRDDLRQYYDEIQRFDRFIGLCMDELRRQGVADNTIVIVMADNGRPFPRCKTRLYDSGLKTPLVIWYPPWIKKTATCDSLVSSIDIAPTILELAGLKSSSAVQGVSFLPMLKDPTTTTRRYVFGEHNWHDFTAHERMCTDGTYLYIRNALPQLPASQPGMNMARGGAYQSLLARFKSDQLTKPQENIFIAPRATEELYTVSNDYHQLSNLAGNPEHATALARMRKLLNEWTDQTGDTFPSELTGDILLRSSHNEPIPESRKGYIPRQRGITPGSEHNATEIRHPGPK